MISKTKAVIIFLTGCLLGVLMSAVPLRQSARILRQNYVKDLLEQTNVAYMIAAGRSQELLKNIEQSLPQYVLVLERHWGQNKNTLPAYYFVQRFYKDNAISVPNDIANILASLPPRPPKSCELPIDKDANKPQQNK
jgi:hypothetical protein